ncbi:MAG TPA: ABC transporter ATP-binding protein [Syntrophomonadaceae bacterium]|nr:ABC transporter ATP-binding protein [Syntrophomonadaceae bacterium]
MSAVLVENVSKTLGTLHTIDNISLEVQDNEFVVILGPSGCGKSTLFHIISGLIKPDTGSIYIDGKNWTGKTGRVGYMQQKDLLLPSKNVLSNVAIPLLLKGVEPKTAYLEVKRNLADFGLEGFEKYYPRQLSGGMKQRAALLRTFLFAKDILLLDEPFASLDAITRRKMHLWLKDLYLEYKSTILFVTHDIEEAFMLADRIYILSARPAQINAEYNLKLYPTSLEQQNLKEEILSILE